MWGHKQQLISHKMNNRHPWKFKKNQNPGSFKRVPKIFIFSIVLGAEYLSNVKSIDTFAPTFFGYIISVYASVNVVALNVTALVFLSSSYNGTFCSKFNFDLAHADIKKMKNKFKDAAFFK